MQLTFSRPLFLAMGRAVAGLGSRPEWALVDGKTGTRD